MQQDAGYWDEAERFDDGEPDNVIIGIADAMAHELKIRPGETRTSVQMEAYFNARRFQGAKVTGAHIRDATRYLRRSGVPIHSGSDGYKYAETQQEIDDIYGNLHGRAMSLLKTESLLKRNLRFGEERQARLLPEGDGK